MSSYHKHTPSPAFLYRISCSNLSPKRDRMGAPAIPYSSTEAERRRLENTLDQDLSTLSLTATSSSLSPRRRAAEEDSFSSLSTIGVGRSAPAGPQLDSFDASFPRFPSTLDTPKARAARGVSMRTETTLGGISPTSTAGHHVSAATLGAGVFRRPAARGVSTGAADEFDPDRSLGRLVGELAKAMGDEVRAWRVWSRLGRTLIVANRISA